MCDLKRLSSKIYRFDDFSFYSASESPNYWLEHGHEAIQITFPQTGASARISSQSSTGKPLVRSINAGQTFIVSAGQSHALDWQQTAELTLIYLHPTLFVRAIDEAIEEDKLEICDRLSLTNDTLIREVGEIFHYLLKSGLAEDRLYLECLANLLAVHLLKNYTNCNSKISSPQKGLSPRKLNLVLEYIDANLDRKITLANLAAIANLGKFYFSRLFKNSTNLTPYRYILHRRVERAKQLLKHSKLPISAIALECGFSNQSHFTKHFHNMVGISPMNYRRKVY